MTYVIAGFVGMLVAFVTWFFLTRWIAASVIWTEARYPHIVGTRGFRVSEIIACSLVVVACLALAFWIARMLVR